MIDFSIMLCRATLGRQQGAGWLVTTARQRLDVVLSGEPNLRQLEPDRGLVAATERSPRRCMNERDGRADIP